MDPFIGAWLLREAVKLIAVPIGTAGWDEFTAEIGKRVGRGGADLVVNWVGRAQGAPDDVRGVALELQQRPEVASALSTELGRQLGVELAPKGRDTPSAVGTDEYVVDAYEAILWRLAFLAYVEGRPIAVCGALQGPEWITVCIPHSGLAIGDPKPPAPGDIWTRFDTKMLRLRDDQGRRADFVVKRTAVADVPGERDLLNRTFRRGDRGFPPDDREHGLLDRWHRVDGVASLWVQLHPDGGASSFMIQNGASFEDIQNPSFDRYPPEWRPLLDIPDEIAGLATLDRCADEFATTSERLRARIGAVGNGHPNPLRARIDEST